VVVVVVVVRNFIFLYWVTKISNSSCSEYYELPEFFVDPTRISEPCTSEVIALCKWRAIAVSMGWVFKF
jgi:hypothetical protein